MTTQVSADAESLNGMRGIIVAALAAAIAFWLPVLLAVVEWFQAN